MGWQRVVVGALLVVLVALGLLEVMAERLLGPQPLVGVASRGGGSPTAWPVGISISDEPDRDAGAPTEHSGR